MQDTPIVNKSKYKIIFTCVHLGNPVDYVFIASDETHARAEIMKFNKIYEILHIWRYNYDHRKYEPVKALEDEYVKKTK